MIDKDEFLQWRDNPVTRWVIEAIQLAAEEQREQFLARVFYGDEADPYNIALMRGAFLALMSVVELTHERVAQLHESGELQLDLNGVWTAPGSGERQ